MAQFVEYVILTRVRVGGEIDKCLGVRTLHQIYPMQG